MKKAIVILIVIILILTTLIIVWYFLQKKQVTELTKRNDVVLLDLRTKLIDREKRIKELYENPTIKIEYVNTETIKTLTDPQKELLIFKLQDQNAGLITKNNELFKIIDDDTIIMKQLQSQLDKTNEALKKQFKPNWAFAGGVLGAIDTKLNVDCFATVNIRKYFLDGRVFLDFGGNFKFYQNFGGGLNLGVGVSW
jgi:hypothetical protein